MTEREMVAEVTKQARYVRSAWHLTLLLAAGCSISAHAAVDGVSVAAQYPVHQPLRHYNSSGLEERIRTLSRGLDLDPTQQSSLRKFLEIQSEQVRKVWSDSSVPAAYRVSVTQAISDRTADEIRALLNEEQRKRFNPPKPPRDDMAGSVKLNVDDWMDAVRPK